MYGYIYITTNLVNNKKYLGKHAKPEFDKSYYGSGTILKKAIEKYGKENFVSEPIDWAESKEELNQKEIQWIYNLNAVDSDEYYNLAIGGDGAGNGKDHPMYRDHRFAGENNPMYGKVGKLNPMYGIKRTGSNNPNYGKGDKITGSNNPRASAVIQYDLEGNIVREYSVMKDVKKFGFSISCVSDCCRGRTKTSGGYIWRYKEKKG